MLAIKETNRNKPTTVLALIPYHIEYYVTCTHLADKMVSTCLRHVAPINKGGGRMQPSEPIPAYTAVLRMTNPAIRLKALREIVLSHFLKRA